MRRVAPRSRRTGGNERRPTGRGWGRLPGVEMPRGVYLVSGVAVAALIALWIARSIWSADIGAGIGRMAIAASAGLGLRVDEVLLEGRVNAPRPRVLDAVRVRRGDPLLTVALNDIRRRLESIPWIREAAVRRHWPDQIHIRIDERRPIALWQHGRGLVLVDEGGATIRTEDVERFHHLLVIVGKDAPAHAEKLLSALATQPALRRRVLAAIRVGARRWDVRFRSGVEVLLPEKDISGAWARLARLEKEHGLIKKNVRLIDMRLPDRLIVRTKTKPTPAGAGGGRRT